MYLTFDELLKLRSAVRSRISFWEEMASSKNEQFAKDALEDRKDFQELLEKIEFDIKKYTGGK